MPKAKTKADVEKELKEALSALKDLESGTSSGPVDLSSLSEKQFKIANLFLEQASDKRKVEPDKILAACLLYCATLSKRRHGIHLTLQTIEQATRCKIK
tara:strand:- start:3913 stop:4209 length:297 start_codon:yes stop_codon:yes gene_type:complete